MIGTVFAALSLLSGNAVGNGVKAEWPRIDTKATVAWVTNGVFASHPQYVATALDARGRSRLLNGNVFGDGNAMVFGAWGAGRKKASFVVDLKSLFLVDKITLWSAEQRGLRGCASFSVALSRDGTTFTELAKHENPADYDVPQKGNAVVCSPLDCALEKPSVARYVRIVAEQHPGRHQMVLGEVAVWGEPPPVGTDIEELSPENRRPTVPLTVDGWSSGAATFAWTGFPAAGDVVKWRLYASDRPFGDIRDEGVARLAELGKDTTSHAVYPLVPNVTRHYAVTAVYPTGECPKVKSLAHAPIGALEVTRFRDMLGFNFFWGGGGANSQTKAYYDVAADFLVDIGIRRIRWWHTPEWAMRDQYLKRGIEICGWTGQKEVARKYGLYLHDIGNEPELSPMTPVECVEMHRKARENWKDMGSDYKFYGPVVNIGTRGFEYLKGFVEAGGAQYVDAIDLHTYCASTAEYKYPEGYPWGSPEAIVGCVKEIRAYLKEKGVDKPLTCSEWGYSDTTTANPHMQDPTPLRKAQFLVRGCILHHALDFRRLYMYSFYDEGMDPNYSEHLFGVVARDCQKKPAYHALRNMVATLGEAKIVDELSGRGDGDFGYVFRNVDKPGFATVVWNGARERNGVFRTAAREVEIVSMFGERRAVKTKEDGTFRVRFGASPVYLLAPERVALVSVADAKRHAPEVADRLVVTTAASVAAFGADETPQIAFQVKNPLVDSVDLMLTVKNLAGETVAERKSAMAPGGTEAFVFPVDLKGTVLDRFTLTVDYDADGESFCENRAVWVRRLGAKTDGTTVSNARFANLDHPVKVLGSAALEITVDPEQGGQILEIWDKRNKTNQLTVDYDKLGTLASIPFAYCLWSSVAVYGVEGAKPPWPNFRRGSRFAAAAVEGGLVLTSENRGVRLTETMALAGDRFAWKVEAVNGTGGTAKMRWHIHPEYTIAGAVDSYQDYMLIPPSQGEYKLVFWSGLGERKLDDISAGWWRMIDPKAGYEIRQDFAKDDFQAPKLWFGVGAWNVEMLTKIVDVKPGDTFAAALAWTFSVR